MGRKSKADQRRIQVIQAFYQCVVDQGLVGTSIRKIATAAGVQPSILHHYFKSREEIIEEAIEYYTEGIFEGFREQMASMADNMDRNGLDQGLEFIFSSGMINDDHTGFFLECLVAARQNQRVKTTIADLFDRFRGAIVDHLELMPGFNALEPSQKTLLASTVVAIHEGIELQWFADPDRVDLAGVHETTRGIIAFFVENAGQSSSKKG